MPVLRNAEGMRFAEIEKSIADLAKRAKANNIRPEELQGGTFTITNGGVYGRCLSTPIVNPPQSGVLGCTRSRSARWRRRAGRHPSDDVPGADYDHRIVDGREAVTFLKSIKDTIEESSSNVAGSLLLDN